MIYCLIGPSNSGKTTLAQTMVRYMNAVIVNRDSLREMLFGYTPKNVAAYYDRDDFNALEKTVSGYQDVLIRQALKLGKDVFVDNTHLTLKYINELKKYDQPIKFIPIEIDFETAKERDSFRERSVGIDVLRKQFEKYEHLKKNFDFADYTPTPVEPLIIDGRGLPSAFVFDIDGTLALNTSGRSPYDMTRVGEDTVNEPVAQILRILGEEYPIILCSGRTDDAVDATRKWLDDNGIDADELYMRDKGDNRKDYIVKEEFYRDIDKNYNVVAMFDDRQQVVDHARKLGFTVLQVAPGNF